jgi:hypothetical protein
VCGWAGAACEYHVNHAVSPIFHQKAKSRQSRKVLAQWTSSQDILASPSVAGVLWSSFVLRDYTSSRHFAVGIVCDTLRDRLSQLSHAYGSFVQFRRGSYTWISKRLTRSMVGFMIKREKIPQCASLIDSRLPC